MSDLRIELWYGSDLAFGRRGTAQRWLNVLGRVVPAERVRSLEVSLDGARPQPLAVGPDKRRLSGAGDFNVEIDTDELSAEVSTVDIIAHGRAGERVCERVRVSWHADRHGTPPCTIDWGRCTAIGESAQIVDGLWHLTAGGIRTLEPGYDRLVAIGDRRWRDYEVSVPVTIHGHDDVGFRYPSNGPGVGLLLRWQGQHDWRHEPGPKGSWPLRTLRRATGKDDWGRRPRWGWWPLGAIGWYRWSGDGAGLSMIGNRGAVIASDPRNAPRTGLTYVFKMSVETVPDRTSRYRLKVWDVEGKEPESWQLEGHGIDGELTEGSAVLVAHHVDATFGNVSVRAIDRGDAAVAVECDRAPERAQRNVAVNA